MTPHFDRYHSSIYSYTLTMAFQGQKLKTKVVVKTFGVLQSFLLPTTVFIPDFVLFLVYF
jgi:hypothetical protein